MNSLLIVYIMTPFFLILLLFGERSLKACSFVIFTSCVLTILTDNKINPLLSHSEIESLFIFYCNISIIWDSVCALLLITSKLFNQESGKQALLLCFAVFCHMMVAYGLVLFFRTWYVELILLVGLLQMMVIQDGFRAAVNELWKSVNELWKSVGGLFIDNGCDNSRIFEREET